MKVTVTSNTRTIPRNEVQIGQYYALNGGMSNLIFRAIKCPARGNCRGSEMCSYSLEYGDICFTDSSKTYPVTIIEDIEVIARY